MISAPLTVMPMPPARHARRAPTRAIHGPFVSMATIDPTATASSANDSVPGLSANLSRTVGTWTPHDAYSIPATKNTAMDETRARWSLATGSRRWAATGLSPTLPMTVETESDTRHSLCSSRWVHATADMRPTSEAHEAFNSIE